jgi:hypothetical protein
MVAMIEIMAVDQAGRRHYRQNGNTCQKHDQHYGDPF